MIRWRWLFEKFFPVVFSGIRLWREKCWRPQRLAWVTLLMAWDEGQTLSSRWEHAKDTARCWHPSWKLGTSYGGFSEALVRSSETLLKAIKARLCRQMRQFEPRCGSGWRWGAFAVDGTRFEAPHVEANERGLGCAGREKTGPQVFATMLWHMGTGLPWDFRVGPGTDSERKHLESLIDDLPQGSLLIADAGFVGYELCRKIHRSGQFFLFRVGSNITLLTKLGYEYQERRGLVYLWPQKQRHQPPLVLRLIKVKRRAQTIYLLTNVLDARQLTLAEASRLYEMRWGIEVFYRSAKQTLERRRLLSRTPATCLIEAQWTLLGIWLLGLLTVRELVERKIDPVEISYANARDVVRGEMRRATRVTSRSRRRPPLDKLRQELASASKDRYHRSRPKRARNYPRKKRERPPGPPKIRSATLKEQATAKRFRELTSPYCRTA